MTEEYNGHPSWEHWNVCLWIGNDEGLYRLAQSCSRECSSPAAAARMFIAAIHPTTRTPDGCTYTQDRVERAITNLFNEEN